MNKDLILKDVSDPVIRENFFRIQRYLEIQSIIQPDWKFFEVTLPPGDMVPIAHGLLYVPKDIIVTSVLGDQSYYFVFNKFDRQNIYISTSGKTTIRFFAGTVAQNPGANPNVSRDLKFTPPGYTVDGGQI